MYSALARSAGRQKSSANSSLASTTTASTPPQSKARWRMTARSSPPLPPPPPPPRPPFDAPRPPLSPRSFGQPADADTGVEATRVGQDNPIAHLSSSFSVWLGWVGAEPLTGLSGGVFGT